MPRSFHLPFLIARVGSFVALAVIGLATVCTAIAADALAATAKADSAGSPPYPRSTVPANGKAIHFKRTVLDMKFRGEGVAVGDFNHDGKLDIAAGNVYYSAPDWKMHVIYGNEPKEWDPHGYSDEFIAFADDLNHDGWTDYIVVGFPGKEAFWYENPKGAPGPWKRHLIGPVANTESPQYLDIDGNGHKSLLMADGRSSNGDRSARPERSRQAVDQRSDFGEEGTGNRQIFARHRRRLDSQ